MKAEQAEQKRKIQVLEYLNSVVGDLISNGFNLNSKVVDKISKKKVQDMQDIEQLTQLIPTKVSNIHKQDKGEYRRVSYEQITLDQLPLKNSLGLTEEASNDNSSSYDRKLETVAGGVKIVVKVKIK